MRLTTRKIIFRHECQELPISFNVIKRVKELTKDEDKDLTFANRHGNAINDNADIDKISGVSNIDIRITGVTNEYNEPRKNYSGNGFEDNDDSDDDNDTNNDDDKNDDGDNMNFPPYPNKSSAVTEKYEENEKYPSTNSDISPKMKR